VLFESERFANATLDVIADVRARRMPTGHEQPESSRTALPLAEVKGVSIKVAPHALLQ